MNTQKVHFRSPIGNIEIHYTENGVNYLQFVEGPFKSEFENLDFLGFKIVSELEKYFEDSSYKLDLPIDQSFGTEFQQKVWKELYEVPFGKTLSYGELAKKLGDPKCVRAAAAANGKNKIAILIPCHRIIGADQSLVGYAWGKSRKRWLLQHEFRLALGVQTLF